MRLVCRDFVKAFARIALDTDSTIWSDWQAVPVAETECPDDAVLDDLTSLLPGESVSWTVTDWTEADPENEPPIAEVLPQAAFTAVEFTNSGAEAITINGIAVCADNSESGETDVIAFEPCDPAVTLENGEKLTIDEYALVIAELSDL